MKADSIVDIAKRRGIFWQSALIYGGVSGLYDYAHIGTLLKRKWETLWRRYFLGLDDNFYEVEATNIMPEAVLKASGHVDSFVDPVVKCKKCGAVERADHILEDVLEENFEGLDTEEMSELIRKHNIRCGQCDGELEVIGEKNLMFSLKLGAGNETKKAYLRPETAQSAYINFKLAFDALRKRMPFGLAIIGKAFRNEISPRNLIIRMREFTQAELQIFFDPGTIKEHPKWKDVANYKLRLFPVKNRKKGVIDEVACRDVEKYAGLPRFYVYYMAKIQQFYLDVLKLPKGRFRFRQLSDEEKAFYNKYHWDIEFNLDSLSGFKEMAGIHYRTDHDLGGHQKMSGEKHEINIEGNVFVPHVLELSFGVDRNLYALLELSYEEEKDRTVLKFPRLVSPFDAGVFPLVNKDGLPEKAREIVEMLRDYGFQVFYDRSGSIGRRYRRIDEIGVACGITVDYDTLKKDSVTLRDRNSMDQVRVKVNELPAVLRKFLHGEKLEKLGKKVK